MVAAGMVRRPSRPGGAAAHMVRRPSRRRSRPVEFRPQEHECRGQAVPETRPVRAESSDARQRGLLGGRR
ncbi:hypothetical protein ADK74_06150 [Streptomyces decoyicus]|nr:hypothetical protein ADK74_06150 [Streptomyces decoyicus]